MPKTDIQNLAGQLKALSSERRLRILAHIKKNKTATVGEIAEAVGVSIEAASKHLQILRLAGIVRANRRGKFNAYRLALRQEEPARGILREL